MKLIELHILQTFPVSCLNRDDLNSPKTAVFGGVQRARVSSQCWKRAIRQHAAELMPAVFTGQRLRYLPYQFSESPEAKSLSPEERNYLGQVIGEQLSKIDSKDQRRLTTSVFLSSRERTAMYSAAATAWAALSQEDRTKLLGKKASENEATQAEKGKAKKGDKADAKAGKDLAKAIYDALLSIDLRDGADVAIFGRMVADNDDITLEGAAMFSHALSTHKVDNEIDFFSTVAEFQPPKTSGADMTGTLEFNSATYYRFAALNLTMLEDEDHLSALSRDERREVVRAFIEATLKAVPGARQNSMNAATLPGCVLGIVRERGQPLQLVNAFETAVRLRREKSLGETSEELLRAANDRTKTTWGIVNTEEVWMPETNLTGFLDKLTAHV